MPRSQPPAPTGTWAFAEATSNSVHWNSVYAATSYSVYRGTASGKEGISPIASGLTVSPYTDTSVTAGTTYYYEVQAYYGSTGSALSSECSADPGSTVLSAPVVYGVAGGPGVNQAQINFSAVTGATYYHVFREGPGQSGFQLLTTTTSL